MGDLVSTYKFGGMEKVLKIPGENILFPYLADFWRLPTVLIFWSPPLSTKLAMSNIKNLQTINSGDDVEKGNVGGKVNWYSYNVVHYGEQYGSSSKN